MNSSPVFDDGKRNKMTETTELSAEKNILIAECKKKDNKQHYGSVHSSANNAFRLYFA